MSLRIQHSVQVQQSPSSDLKSRCYTCLCLHRNLKPLEDRNKYLLALLCPELFQKDKQNTQNLICWECELMTVKIKRFQAKLIKACVEREKNVTKDEGLSNLKRTKIEIIGLPPQIKPKKEPVQTIMPTATLKEDMKTIDIEIKKEESGDCEEQIQVTRIRKRQQQESSDDSTDTASETDTEMNDPLMTLTKNNKKYTKKQITIEVPPKEAVPKAILAPTVKFNKKQKVFQLQAYGRPVKFTAEVPNLITDKDSNLVLVKGESTPIAGKNEASDPVKGRIASRGKSKATASNLLKGKGIPLILNVVKGEEIGPKLVKSKGNIPLIKTREESILSLLKHNQTIVTRQSISNSQNPSREPVEPKPGHEETLKNIEGIYGHDQDEVKCKILNRTELNAYRDSKRSGIGFKGWKNKCDRCLERFNTEEKLIEHNKKHDESRGPFVCDVCEQRFTEEHFRDYHHKMHFVMYECLKCQYQNHDRIHISVHIRQRHEVSSFECKKCDAVFKSYREQHRHRLNVHGKRRTCEECNKTFSSLYQLKLHMSNLHRKETAECPICKKKVRKSYLEIHKKTHEPSKEDSVRYCAICEKTYKNRQSYERHLKVSLKHNTVEEIGFRCDHCDKYFPNAASLKNHTEEINGVKHKCHICNKECKNKIVLKRHVRVIHLGEKRHFKPSICEYCGKSFTIKKSLDQHINKHLGKRPFVCKDCGATFIYSAALFTHRRLVHKVKRRYEMTNEVK